MYDVITTKSADEIKEVMLRGGSIPLVVSAKRWVPGDLIFVRSWPSQRTFLGTVVENATDPDFDHLSVCF